MTDDFIAYTKEIGPQLGLEETTAFLVVAATLLDLKAARLLPAGQVDDEEDLALLEVRDLLFARLLQYRAFKHVAQMFAELEAAALRSYPRAVSLEDRFADLLPEVMLGVDAEAFAEIAASRVHAAAGADGGHRPSAPREGVGTRAGRATCCALLEQRGVGAVGVVHRTGRRLPGADRDRGTLPGAARTVPDPGGSIRAVRTAWCAPGFVDRRQSHGATTARRAGGRVMTEPDARGRPGYRRRHRPELDDDELGRVLEALLLVVDTPVTAEALAAATEQPVYRIAARLQLMADELTARDSGIDLREAGGGWRMYTRARFAPYVERLLLDGSRSKLTRAALETLAVVAYRQPVTRARVSAVRGVNVDAVMRTLLARGLITEAGSRSPTPAR